VAIAHPCDDVSLECAVEARLRLIEPVLVGPVARIQALRTARGGISAQWK
jgi:phosphate acetyltransferase